MAVADVIVSLGVLAAFYGVLALGMNVKYGHTGLLDFGHVGFYLIGAYTAVLLIIPAQAGGPDTVYIFGLDLPSRIAELTGLPITASLGWLITLTIAMVLAGIVGVFVALPTLRLREDYLAITVLGIAAIFQRIVQAETWLANGPDALRGYSPPLINLFPVGGETIAGAAVMALAGGAIWAATAWALGRVTDRNATSPGTSIASRLHTLATFGTDRRFKRADGNPGGESSTMSKIAGIGQTHHSGSAVVAGLVAGVAGGLLTFVAEIGLAVWGTILSVFTWIVLLIWLYRYSADFDAVDYLVTLALGTGYMLALAPMFFLKNFWLWVPLTIVAFGVVIGVTFYLRRNWAPFGSDPFRYGLFTALWFGIIWYYPIQILSSLQAGNLIPAATTVYNNVVWVLSFSGATPQIGYSRFKLFLFGSLLLVALYLMELTVESPFGRVLRAVRNDERVVNALGKDPFMYKVQSMAMGSALAGLAGAMAALHFQVLVFTMFAPRVTFIALLMMFLGGVGNNRAMVVGAFLFWAFQTATTQMSGFVAAGLRENIQAFRFVVMGVLFLALLYYRPEGLVGERSATGAGNE